MIEIKPGIFITLEQQLEFRKQCIAGLRSGEFYQVYGALEHGGGNCCLGVFCRIFDRMFPGILTITTFSRTAFDESTTLLPRVVQNALGMRSGVGRYADGCLTVMNDMGVPFSVIADTVESNPPGLWMETQ